MFFFIFFSNSYCDIFGFSLVERFFFFNTAQYTEREIRSWIAKLTRADHRTHRVVVTLHYKYSEWCDIFFLFFVIWREQSGKDRRRHVLVTRKKNKKKK